MPAAIAEGELDADTHLALPVRAGGRMPLVGALAPDGDSGPASGPEHVMLNSAAHTVLSSTSASLHVDAGPWWWLDCRYVDARWGHANGVRPLE